MPPPSAHAHPAFAGFIGVARADITPPTGIYARNWGAASHDVAEGVHRPLTATVLTVQATASDPPLILAGLDLGWWRSLDDERFVRGGLLDALSIDPARVMIALAHTHAGPSICREDARQPGGHLIGPYLEKLRDAIVGLARQALRSAAPATLAWGRGRCDLAQDRDLADPERNRIVCGYNPDGAPDDTLLVGRVTERSGRVLATLVNYACHPTTLAWDNRLISPDYVGAMREVIEGQTGGAPCLFLQGASGELAPAEQYVGDPAVADRNGRRLGFASASALEGIMPPGTELQYAGIVESGAPLATWRRAPREASRRLDAARLDVEVPLKPMESVAEIERALKTCADRVAQERLLRKRRVRAAVGDGQTSKIPVWIWRVGDAFLVGQPDEAYAHLQVELRRRFPAHAVAVMNLVNGSCGYLPPAPLYDREMYQVAQTPFGRGSLEELIEACGSAIGRLLSANRER